MMSSLGNLTESKLSKIKRRKQQSVFKQGAVCISHIKQQWCHLSVGNNKINIIIKDDLSQFIIRIQIYLSPRDVNIQAGALFSTTYLYESSDVSQFRLWSQSQVEDHGEVDGNHRHHVDNVQRVMKELLPVRCEQQPRHHLEGEPAGAEHLQSLHGRVLDQLPVRVKSLRENNRLIITFSCLTFINSPHSWN